MGPKTDRKGGLRILLVLFGGALAWGLFHFGSAAKTEKIYQSTAVLQVATPFELVERTEKEAFSRQEIAQMTSDAVLAPVVSSLGLAEHWAVTPQQALVLLRGQTSIDGLPERGTRSRFSITVKEADAELARSIAALIASEYQEQGNARARVRFEEERAALNLAIADQQRIVAEKRLRLEKAHRQASQKWREEGLSPRPEKAGAPF